MNLTRWEVRIEELAADDLGDKLSAWGLRGWEVVACVPIVRQVPIRIGENGLATTEMVTYHTVCKKPLDANPEEPSPPQPTPTAQKE